MSSQKKIVKANGAAPDEVEDKVAGELLNLEVRALRCRGDGGVGVLYRQACARGCCVCAARE